MVVSVCANFFCLSVSPPSLCIFTTQKWLCLFLHQGRLLWRVQVQGWLMTSSTHYSEAWLWCQIPNPTRGPCVQPQTVQQLWAWGAYFACLISIPCWHQYPSLIYCMIKPKVVLLITQMNVSVRVWRCRRRYTWHSTWSTSCCASSASCNNCIMCHSSPPTPGQVCEIALSIDGVSKDLPLGTHAQSHFHLPCMYIFTIQYYIFLDLVIVLPMTITEDRQWASGNDSDMVGMVKKMLCGDDDDIMWWWQQHGATTTRTGKARWGPSICYHQSNWTIDCLKWTSLSLNLTESYLLDITTFQPWYHLNFW